MMRKISTLAMVVCCTLVSACGPKVKDLVVADEFRSVPLAGSALVIGGLRCAFSSPAADTLVTDGASFMRQVLIARLSGVDIPPADYVAEKLGPDRDRAALDQFRESLAVPDEDLASVGIVNGRERSYVVMSRVESDRAWTSREEKKDSNNVVLSKTYLAHRQLLATMKVWDLRSHKCVWSGQVTGKTTAKNTIDKKDELKFSDLGLGTAGKVLDWLASDDDESESSNLYPAFPGLGDAMQNLFENFSDAFSSR
jgi:hypothetical protein